MLGTFIAAHALVDTVKRATPILGSGPIAVKRPAANRCVLVVDIALRTASWKTASFGSPAGNQVLPFQDARLVAATPFTARKLPPT